MIESFATSLSLFTQLDGIAFTTLFLGWFLIGFLIDRNGKRRSTHALISDFRSRWMIEMVGRENRVADIQILSSLRQGTAFFMSASMIGIGGTLALLGSADTLEQVATEVSPELSAPQLVWEIKLIVVAMILVSAFLKFVWSHRLFGYCAVVLGSVPNDKNHPDALGFAAKAAKLNTYAARSFNRGLRAVYFAMAALTWLLGSIPLIVAVTVTLAVLYRREFHSLSRAALLAD